MLLQRRSRTPDPSRLIERAAASEERERRSRFGDAAKQTNHAALTMKERPPTLCLRPEESAADLLHSSSPASVQLRHRVFGGESAPISRLILLSGAFLRNPDWTVWKPDFSPKPRLDCVETGLCAYAVAGKEN
ncbi:hypothetical protein AGIG_G18911 [Arapaima gigas]